MGDIIGCNSWSFRFNQEKSKPVWLLMKGDVVEILPGSAFAHIAISTRYSLGPVVWMDPVTDEGYNSYVEQ